jgi:hypothetical protein
MVLTGSFKGIELMQMKRSIVGVEGRPGTMGLSLTSQTDLPYLAIDRWMYRTLRLSQVFAAVGFRLFKQMLAVAAREKVLLSTSRLRTTIATSMPVMPGRIANQR